MVADNLNREGRGNFYGSLGQFYLVRCYECPNAGERGVENYLPSAASGTCAWCGATDTRGAQK